MIYSKDATSSEFSQSNWIAYCAFVRVDNPDVLARWAALDRNVDMTWFDTTDFTGGNVSVNCAEAKIPVELAALD